MRPIFKIFLFYISFVLCSCSFDKSISYADCSEDSAAVKDLSSIVFDTIQAIKFIRKIDSLKKTNINKKIYETVLIDGSPKHLGRKWTPFIEIGFIGDFNNDLLRIQINDKEMLPIILNSRPNDMDFYDGFLSYWFSTQTDRLTLQINNQCPILLQCDSLHYVYEVFLKHDTLLIKNVKQLRNFR